MGRLQAADQVVPLQVKEPLTVEVLIARDLKQIARPWCSSCDGVFVNGLRFHKCSLRSTAVPRRTEESEHSTVGQLLRETVRRLGAAHFRADPSLIEEYSNAVENRATLYLERSRSVFRKTLISYVKETQLQVYSPEEVLLLR